MTKPANAAEDPNELPEEEASLYRKQLGIDPKLIDGPIEQTDFSPLEDDEERRTGQQFFQDKIFDAMRYWSQFTNYSIDLDDGTKLKFYRVPATKSQLNQLDELSAITASRYVYTPKGKKKFLDPMELLQKQRELERLKVNTYLRLYDTNKPPTMEQIGHVADSTDIDGILEACHAISESKWHQGKKG